jgi:hypothetical protein
MTKVEIAARLTAAGIEIPEGATVAVLTDLAKANNVDLKEATPPVDGGTPPSDQPEPGESPIDAQAKKEVAQLTPAAAPKGITEEAIAEKTRFGLTRAQAIEVLTTQAAHDAQLAKEEKEKGKA